MCIELVGRMIAPLHQPEAVATKSKAGHSYTHK